MTAEQRASEIGAFRQVDQSVPGVSESMIHAAVEVLRRGGLVAIPTETVYGLAADALNGQAVARIYEAKGRPQFNPLIVHVDGIAMAARFGRLDALSLQLAERFWPGPLTLVVPLAAGAPVHPLALAGLDTVALRAPCGPAQAIIAALGGPIAAPSANSSGRISPTRADDVSGDLGSRVDLILDGGATAIGVESTIVMVEREIVRLLRPGGVTRQEIEAEIGRTVTGSQIDAAISAPGMLASHYAPVSRVRLDAREAKAGEAFLAFGKGSIQSGFVGPVLDLSPTGDLREAAANLFGHLRALDGTGVEAIAVAPIPDEGLGEAINDRLRRAAAPR